MSDRVFFSYEYNLGGGARSAFPLCFLPVETPGRERSRRGASPPPAGIELLRSESMGVMPPSTQGDPTPDQARTRRITGGFHVASPAVPHGVRCAEASSRASRKRRGARTFDWSPMIRKTMATSISTETLSRVLQPFTGMSKTTLCLVTRFETRSQGKPAWKPDGHTACGIAGGVAAAAAA